MKNANEVRCADCGGRVVSEEVLKAKDQLDTLRVSLEMRRWMRLWLLLQNRLASSLKQQV